MTQEELQEQLLKMQEQIKQFEEDNKALKTALEEKTRRENELMEHNQKLFLRLTNNVKQEDEEEIEIPKCIDEELFSKLSKKEIEELKEILEDEEE